MEKQKRKFVTPVHTSKFIFGSVTRQVIHHGQNTQHPGRRQSVRHGRNEYELLDIQIFLSLFSLW
jgi:hypothetical protein